MRKELCLLVMLGLLGCGENQSTNPTNQIGPPGNLKALSVNSTTVGLQWTAPTGQADSLGGYVVQVGSKRDTLGRLVTSFMADSLPQGEATFTVYSRSVSGSLSNGTVIKWAPAARFDSAFTLYEYNKLVNVSSVRCALDVGTSTLNPATMTATQPNAPRMDLYLFGGDGTFPDSLALQSINVLVQQYNMTLFSTVTHHASGLDYYLASFPDASTFTLTSVPVIDNTIYYVKVVGDAGSVNYARLHVRLAPGDFPSRAVSVRVSLQRTPGLLYACREDRAIPHEGTLAFLLPRGIAP